MAKPTKVVSPKGVFVYPRLNQPDTKFDPDGTYHLKIRCDSDEPEIAGFIEKIDKWHAESMAEFKDVLANTDNPKLKSAAAKKKAYVDGDKPYSYEVDDDTGEDTNIVLFSFKMKAHVTSRKTGKSYDFTPTILDAGKKVLKGDAIPSIYGGTVGKVRFEPILWNSVKLGASVQLRMDAVQILELVSSGEDTGGFDEEDGYEGSDATPGSENAAPAGEDNAPAASDDDGSGDF